MSYTRRVFDCFSFFNELDILELRLNILDPVVDYFVICEANITHSGHSKPFYYEDNKERFTKWAHKIIHVKVTDIPENFNGILPIYWNTEIFDEKMVNRISTFVLETTLFNLDTEPHYGRDFWQKESCRRGLESANDEDIILFSDVDEIPQYWLLQHYRTYNSYSGELMVFQMRSYYYYLNMLKETDWLGTRIGLWKDMKEVSWNQLRKDQQPIIPNGGWHFSFQGDADRVRQKIEAYSHQELNTDTIKDSIAQNIATGQDPYNRGSLRVVPVDSSFPQYLLDNIDQYRHMIHE